MRVLRTFVIAALTVVTAGTFARAAERVDLLLVLAADISRSMDEAKFQLQRSGYAAAFSNPQVIEAIRAGPLSWRRHSKLPTRRSTSGSTSIPSSIPRCASMLMRSTCGSNVR
jgi:hypothetical protein